MRYFYSCLIVELFVFSLCNNVVSGLLRIAQIWSIQKRCSYEYVVYSFWKLQHKNTVINDAIFQQIYSKIIRSSRLTGASDFHLRTGYTQQQQLIFLFFTFLLIIINIIVDNKATANGVVGSFSRLWLLNWFEWHHMIIVSTVESFS